MRESPDGTAGRPSRSAARRGCPEPGAFSLALGGGGARGLAHIGVLRVLEEQRLCPRAIAGTSMGAVVGALFAAGIEPADLESVVDSLDLRDFARVAAFTTSRESILTADRFERRLREVLPADFSGLRMPYAAVATDLGTGERVVLTEGDLPHAVRASMSIPIVLDPVGWDEALLVDGGLVDPVPVGPARELGGDPVVAVDVGPLVATGRLLGAEGNKPLFDAAGHPGALQIGARSFDVMQHWIARTALAGAAVVITPDVGGFLMTDFLQGAAIMGEGERAAIEALGGLRAALAL